MWKRANLRIIICDVPRENTSNNSTVFRLSKCFAISNAIVGSKSRCAAEILWSYLSQDRAMRSNLLDAFKTFVYDVE